MNEWNHEFPWERNHMWHLSRFTQINGNHSGHILWIHLSIYVAQTSHLYTRSAWRPENVNERTITSRWVYQHFQKSVLSLPEERTITSRWAYHHFQKSVPSLPDERTITSRRAYHHFQMSVPSLPEERTITSRRAYHHFQMSVPSLPDERTICFRPLLCTSFRLNWAKQTPGIMRRN